MGLSHAKSNFNNLDGNFAFTDQLQNFIPASICHNIALLQEMYFFFTLQLFLYSQFSSASNMEFCLFKQFKDNNDRSTVVFHQIIARSRETSVTFFYIIMTFRNSSRVPCFLFVSINCSHTLGINSTDRCNTHMLPVANYCNKKLQVCFQTSVWSISFLLI